MPKPQKTFFVIKKNYPHEVEGRKYLIQSERDLSDAERNYIVAVAHRRWRNSEKVPERPQQNPEDIFIEETWQIPKE
jgi:hypothetical protein